MTKFWMTTMVAIMALGLTTGCPDDDSCPVNICDECGNGFCGAEEYAGGECPEDCGSGFCGDGICEGLGAGRETCSICPDDCGTCSDGDADADADSDTTEDDGDTSEVVNCPNIAGDWALTYRESESGMEGHYTLTLEQSGCLVIGWDEDCEYTGSVLETGYVSLYRDCYSRDRTVTGTFQTPPHMQGDWSIEETPPLHGTWWADPQ
jgi:hypothetical protein